jgi:hypothetical protein
MSVTGHLVFDPASLSESANVGAHIRAGDDGTVIGHVSDALKVSVANASIAVTATNLDIRDLVFATDKVDVSGSSVSISGTVAVTQSTSPWVVSATNLDIRDLAAATDTVSAWTKDGSGTAINSTSNALNVYVTGSGALTVNDAALANTAGANAALSVGTSSISAVASILASRKYLFAFNNGNKAMYLGFGTVTSANGFPMYAGQAYEFRAGAAIDMKVISTAASQDLRTLELS